MDLIKDLPFIQDLKAYRKGDFKFDFTAGLTVAVVALPQSMAYAMIAGVNPVYGLYTAIVAAVLGSVLGSSNHLITGPTNAISLMIAGQVRYFPKDDVLTMLFFLTLLVGAVQFLLGLLRVGKIINYVSHAVIVGFTAGAGIIIALGQLDQLVGFKLPAGYHPLYEKTYLVLASLDRTNLYALGLALLAVAITVFGKKLHKNIPGALLGIVAGAVLAKAFGLADQGVRLIGEIPNQLPGFRLPDSFGLSRVFGLLDGAVAIAIVGLVEALSISKALSITSGQKIDPNAEFRGQGLANMISSFFQCFPSSGSFTRSAINLGSGARTKLAGVLSGLFVALTLVFFGPYARYIPNAALAGVIVVVAYNMVDKKSLRKILKAGKNDAVVVAITIVATVLMPDLERAILIGIAVSVIVHLWNTGEIRVKLLVHDGVSVFKELEMRKENLAGKAAKITLVHVEGDMYFGSSADLEEKLNLVLSDPNTDICVLRLKGIHVVDISAFEVLELFIERLRKKGKRVLLCGVGPELKRFLDRLGISAKLGEENIFLAEDRIFASTGRAFRRAEELQGRDKALSPGG